MLVLEEIRGWTCQSKIHDTEASVRIDQPLQRTCEPQLLRGGELFVDGPIVWPNAVLSAEAAVELAHQCLIDVATDALDSLGIQCDPTIMRPHDIEVQPAVAPVSKVAYPQVRPCAAQLGARSMTATVRLRSP